MALKTNSLKRVFRHNGLDIPDPAPGSGPEQCLELLSLTYPDLTNASVEPPKIEAGKMVYNMKVTVGTKG